MTEFVLDIGGEGRYSNAWNLNPSPVRTIGENRGEPIRHHIPGRAEAIPFANGSVDTIIVERTPLRLAALGELARVVALNGVIILRHVPPPNRDPHGLAKRILPGRVRQRTHFLGKQVTQETVFRLGR